MVYQSTPLLANSAFSSLSLFPSAPTHIPTSPQISSPRSSSFSSPTSKALPSIPERRTSKPNRHTHNKSTAAPTSPVKISPPIPSRRSSISPFPSPSPESRVLSSFSTPDLGYFPDSVSTPIMSLTSVSEEAARPQTPSPKGRRQAPVVLDSPSSVKTSKSSVSSWSARSLRGLKSMSVVDLGLNSGSPKAVSVELEAEAKKGSVQVEKDKLINWARPFKGGETQSSPIRIFGQSIQRSRRIGKFASASSIDLRLPSPSSSSDDEPMPVTPSTPSFAQVEIPGRSWSVMSDNAGLGVKGIKEFDSPSQPLDSIKEVVVAEMAVSLADLQLDPVLASPRSATVELGSPIIFSTSPGAPVSTPSDQVYSPGHSRSQTVPAKLSASHSLSSLAAPAPASLAELRQLQRAAGDLELHAKRPLRAVMPREAEKRIRRKAVPSAFAVEAEAQASRAAFVRNALASTAGPSAIAQPRMYTLEVAPSVSEGVPLTIERSNSSSSASTGDRGDVSGSASMSNGASSSSESASLTDAGADADAEAEAEMDDLPPRPSSSMDKLRDIPKRFYSNPFATMSVIEVSPRLASLPIFVPARQASKAKTEVSAPIPILTKRNDDDSNSSSGESWDQPVTPNSVTPSDKRNLSIGGNGFFPTVAAPTAAGKQEKKLNGLYGNKSAFLSQLDLGLKKLVHEKNKEESGEKKLRRGFSKLFGRA